VYPEIQQTFSEGIYKTVVPAFAGESQLNVPEASREICSAFIVNVDVLKNIPICLSFPLTAE
jgi:hypothetical protein